MLRTRQVSISEYWECMDFYWIKCCVLCCIWSVVAMNISPCSMNRSHGYACGCYKHHQFNIPTKFCDDYSICVWAAAVSCLYVTSILEAHGRELVALCSHLTFTQPRALWPHWPRASCEHGALLTTRVHYALVIQQVWAQPSSISCVCILPDFV